GRVTHFVAGMGTGGTITGVARYLKERNPAVQVVGVDPEGSVYTEYFRTGRLGTPRPSLIDGLGEDVIPGTIDVRYIDRVIQVSDRDAYRMTLRLAREEAILGGSSSGAAVWAAARMAEEVGPEAVIVVLLPDTGERYLSKLNEAWLREKGLIE
ncbi:MAG: pyridoxal-phosphate dependent enzyme, partial [Acidobacteria bacterium]|nr:pyridoxal-phosphate dependent enzyme [Acidobacteriota bacterium]